MESEATIKRTCHCERLCDAIGARQVARLLRRDKQNTQLAMTVDSGKVYANQ